MSLYAFLEYHRKIWFIYTEPSFSSKIHNAHTPQNTPVTPNNCIPNLFESKLMACWINAQQEETVLCAG